MSRSPIGSHTWPPGTPGTIQVCWGSQVSNRSSADAVTEPPQKTEYRAPLERAREPGEITRVLDSLSRGDDAASERLLRLVYGEIRRLAQSQIRGEDPNRTLQATALIN